MSRDLTSAAQTAAEAGHVNFVYLARLDFDGGLVAVNSGISSYSFNGDTYTGIGSLGSVDVINEGAEIEPYGIELSLTGVDPSLISISLSEDYQGRSAKLYLGLLDSDYLLIDDPVLLFDGRMDYMQVFVGDTGEIKLRAESRLVDWNKARVRRYNNEDQQDRYPGDKGFEFVPKMVDANLRWGR